MDEDGSEIHHLPLGLPLPATLPTARPSGLVALRALACFLLLLHRSSKLARTLRTLLVMQQHHIEHRRSNGLLGENSRLFIAPPLHQLQIITMTILPAPRSLRQILPFFLLRLDRSSG